MGSRQQKGSDDDVLSALNIAIGTLNLAKEVASITPARAIFGSVSVLLAMIRVRFYPLCDAKKTLIHVYLGFCGQRTGLCRTGVILR
jgi:hypothetical protein